MDIGLFALKKGFKKPDWLKLLEFDGRRGV